MAGASKAEDLQKTDPTGLVLWGAASPLPLRGLALTRSESFPSRERFASFGLEAMRSLLV